MKDQKDILRELHSKGTGFTVPDDYFDHFKVEITGSDDNILPEKNGFKVPDNYFNRLEEKILEKIESGIPKDTGFEVPAGYFNDFKVKTEKTKNNKVVYLYKKYRKSFITLAVAASIILLFNVYPILNQPNSMDLSTLTDADIETWLILNSDELNSTEMDNLFDKDAFYETDMISEEDITDYLIQTDLERWLPDN